MAACSRGAAQCNRWAAAVSPGWPAAGSRVMVRAQVGRWPTPASPTHPLNLSGRVRWTERPATGLMGIEFSAKSALTEFLLPCHPSGQLLSGAARDGKSNWSQPSRIRNLQREAIAGFIARRERPPQYIDRVRARGAAAWLPVSAGRELGSRGGFATLDG